MERTELRQLARATGAVIERNGCVLLADPRWSAEERLRVENFLGGISAEAGDGRGWLCIATGGSSGNLRFARHDETTLGAAVDGFVTRVGGGKINALDVLPAHHVSGFMARIRSAATSGRHLPWSWKALEAGEWPELPRAEDGWFLSLVPTQLQRLLTRPEAVERLRAFRTIFIGGGPLWPELAEAARKADLPVANCYGMTETAAMVAAQQPEAFAAGDMSCGRPMPHVEISVIDEAAGANVPAGTIGLLRISGRNICTGFVPQGASPAGVLQTADMGYLDAEGRLHVLGRADALIISGGEKVNPAEVEALLQGTGEFADIAVVGVPDPEWGAAVVACFSGSKDKFDTLRVQRALAGLAPYKRPKRFVAIDPWPRNAQGKLNRAALVAAVQAGGKS